jgi:tellurite resistance protein
MAQTELPRDELAAALEARRELGQELEPQVIDSFLAKIEKQIDARVEQKVRERLPTKRDRKNQPQVALGSLGLAIPLVAIAGGTVGLAGVVVVALAIVIVNVIASSD